MGVERIAVVPELDGDIVSSESFDQPLELDRARPTGPRSTNALGTAPLRHPVRTSQRSPCSDDELGDVVNRTTLLAAQLRE